MKKIDLATLIAALLVGGFFIYAGGGKILNPELFSEQIYYYKLLPSKYINLLAIFLPWLEVVAGIVIICVPKMRQAAAILIALMLIMFIGALMINIARGNVDISCGCTSKASENQKIGYLDVFENLVWLALTAFVFFQAGRRTTSLETESNEPSEA